MTTYSIIGDGAVGTTAAFYIRRHDPNGRITIYSDEPTPAYYRAALTNYLMGELTAQQLFAVPPDFYQQFRVERVHTRVTEIDTDQRRLRLSTGETPSYDKLLIGAGARSRMPEFSGAELGGVKVLRTMQDARYVMDGIQSGRLRHAVIVGGGILGLEWVAGLRTRRVGVSYIIRGNEFMPALLDQAASDLVKSRMRHYGVDLRTNEELDDVFGGPDGHLQAVKLKNSGEVVEAQMLGFAIGIVPNTEFLEGSKIKVKRGIPVDHRMRTNVDGVYAGGDIATVADPVSGAMRGLGLWEPARHHGRTAGINMAGGEASWDLKAQYNATRLYDLDLAAIGETKEKPADEVVVEFPEKGAAISYKKLVFREGRLVGAILLGLRKENPRARGRALHKLVAMGAECSSVRNELLNPFFDVSRFIDSLKSESSKAGAVAKTGAVRTDVSSIMDRPKIFGAPEAGPARPDTPAPGVASRPVGVTEARSLSMLMTRAEAAAVVPLDERQTPGGGESNGNGAVALGPTTRSAAVLRLEDGTLKTLGDVLTIGRGPDNGLALDDPQVSSRHAEIRLGSDGHVIADLESSNGVLVDEVRISTPQTLVDGQTIRLGQTRLTFSQQVTAPRATTGPAGLPDEPLRPSTAGESYGRLVWSGGAFDITEPQTQIGRDPAESDINLDDPAVSWLHAEVGYHDGGCYVRDLGSRNGTYVNTKLVTVPHLLRNGDVIHCGTTDLTFTASAASSAAADRTPETTEGGSKSEGARLRAEAGPLLGLSFALSGERVTVGRDDSCTIALTDLTASRRHAAFQSDRDRWAVVDLASTNGTCINDEPIQAHQAISLNQGDKVKIGDTVFVFDTGAVTVEPSRDRTVAQGPARGATVVAPTDKPAPAATIQQPVPAPVPAPTLVVTAGPRAGTSFALDDLPLIFGREQAEGVTGLDDHFVSGRHLSIERSGEALTVTDLGSTNGTQVDGTALDANSPRPIEPGDRIHAGPRTVLEVKPPESSEKTS